MANAMPDIGLPDWGIPGVYRIPIQQGNLVTQELVNELKPGMTKQQVRYLLGTPLLIDTFQDDRWEYLYTNRPESRGLAVKTENKRLELVFKNGRLIRITGDMYPEGEEQARLTKAENRERTIIVPADAPRDEAQSGFFDSLWNWGSDKKKVPEPKPEPKPEPEPEPEPEPATEKKKSS